VGRGGGGLKIFRLIMNLLNVGMYFTSQQHGTCRFHNPDLKVVEAEDDEVTSISCQENPNYQAGLEGNRARAFQAVSSYVDCKELHEASLLLYQVLDSSTDP